MAVENSSFDMEGNRVNTTVSRIACYPVDAFNMDELLDKADQSLYKSKKAGRNQVCYYSYVDSEDITGQPAELTN